jgi:Protein of unknown function DUF262
MNIIDDVDMHRKQLATDSYTTTWREILSQYKDSDLRIDPEYQRLFRWTIDQQTQFIESLLLGIPSPAIFLAENADGGLEILDGLQRLSTLIKFFAPEIFPETVLATDEDQDSNNIKVPGVLTNGPIVESLEGYTAATLPDTLTRTIKHSRVTVIQIKRESDKTARMEVFRRLNRFGAQLSDQEIRNATARLYGGDFPQRLKETAKISEIRESMAIGDAEKRMGIEEMILRVLALHLGAASFKHTVSEFLDQFMIRATEGKVQLLNEEIEKIIRAFKLIHRVDPNGRVFRFEKSGFSTNLLDVMALGAVKNIDTLTEAVFKTKYELLKTSDALKAVVGAGSNTKKKLLGRIDLGASWFAP